MKKFYVSQIGEFHTNHNEDNLLITEIGNYKTLISVMDGCSMGEESFFASTLLKKIIRKFSKELHYKEFISKHFYSPQESIHFILKNLFKNLSSIKNDLDLEIDELLSTLILGVINSKLREANIIVIGDGLISINGELKEFDQKNKPDYIGYHINEDFENWMISQTQNLTATNIEDLSISTDGIYSFRKFDLEEYSNIEEYEIIDILLNQRYLVDNERMLLNNLLKIEKEYGLKPTDDISIIRVIFN